MKIVFFGSADFAVPALIKLKESNKILTVVTKPDKPKGRRLLTSPSEVKLKAQELGLNISHIEGLSPASASEMLAGYSADLFIAIAYGQILSLDILSLPKFYSVGLHASLLPKYRGASPINWAILNGETQTGVTVFRLNEKMDAGDIISQEVVKILESDNAETLYSRLSLTGADLLSRSIPLIESGRQELKRQNEAKATFTPKLKKEDGLINWTEDATLIHNKVRGLYNWPGTFSDFRGRKIKIWETETAVDAIRNERSKPGEIIKVESSAIFVACGCGVLKIKELQVEGGRRVAVSDYLSGHKISAGDCFTPGDVPQRDTP
ncbi:MAG: methionyl-tRNA formyltransferase [Candidatus Omnitrophota bacterium]